MSELIAITRPNAIGYTRISKEDQSHNSLEYQEQHIRDYCARNKLNLKEIFTDNGQSSYTFDRPDYKALEAFLKKNKDVKYLVFTDHTRFSRNTAEALMKLKEMEDKMGIRVYSTTDNFGTDFSDPTAFILRTLQYVMGESELHNIRKRTRAGILQGKLSGRFMSSAPYGYKNARDVNDKAILVVVEDKAKIIRYIYREYLNGMGVTEISRQTREMGYPNKGKSAITRVLSNPVYCGLITIPNHKDRKSRFAQGIHTPIVSETDYWLVQEKLIHKPKSMPKNSEVPLRGALHCWCGRKLTAGNSKSKTGKYHWYYLCSTHKENLPAKKLHIQFAALLDALSLHPAMIDRLRTRLASEIEEKIKGQDEEIRSLSRDLKAVQLQILSVEKKYLLGQVRDQAFQDVITGLRGNESRLIESLAAAGNSGTSFYGKLTQSLDVLTDIRGAYERLPLEKQHQFLQLGFDSTFHYKNGVYRTRFLHPSLSHNELILNANRLLIVEKPTGVFGENPLQGGSRDTYRTLSSFVELLQLIA